MTTYLTDVMIVSAGLAAFGAVDYAIVKFIKRKEKKVAPRGATPISQ